MRKSDKILGIAIGMACFSVGFSAGYSFAIETMVSKALHIFQDLYSSNPLMKQALKEAICRFMGVC